MNGPEWEGTRNRQSGFRTMSYRCGYCDRQVSASEGYWCVERMGSTLMHEIAICPHCNQPTYFERHQQTVPLPAFGDCVPHINNELIESVYEEARRCTAIGGYTAAAMLCRKILMHVAVEKGADENLKFVQYVDYLAAKGYVPPDGKGWVDTIREKGNDANHEIQIISADDARLIVRFTEMLLRFVYEMAHLFRGKKK